MSQFAANTSVPVEKSRAEIETILTRYGATHFGYMVDPKRAIVMFQAKGRHVRFELPLPDRNARQFTHRRDRRTGIEKQLSPTAAYGAWDQAVRQRWRALALVIKAKLEAVESGITSFEAEFLAQIVLPNGTTVGGWIAPQLAAAYETGGMPPMLALGPGGEP
jgi:hypothetical protein